MTSFTGATESNAFMFRRGFADRDLILSRNGRNPPPHPRLTPSASPTTKPPGGSGTGPEQALERRHPDPPRATARKLSRPQRSLRAQDRSRGAPTHDSPQAPAQRPNHPAAAGTGRASIGTSTPTLSANVWDCSGAAVDGNKQDDRTFSPKGPGEGATGLESPPHPDRRPVKADRSEGHLCRKSLGDGTRRPARRASPTWGGVHPSECSEYPHPIGVPSTPPTS